MAKKEPLFQPDQRLIDTIRRKMQIREELRNEVFGFESQIRQSRNQTYINYIERIADKVGIDMQDFREDAQRRNRIQSRFIHRGYEKFRRQTQVLAREEAEREKEVRKRYLEFFGKQIQHRQGNPELKFIVPVEEGHWTDVYQDPPGAMLGTSGCRQPSFSQHDYSDDIEVGGVTPTLRDHRFLPRIYVATGEDNSDVYVRLVQCIFLRHDALESGRGDFQVRDIRVNLRGVGYSRARVDEGCPFFLNSHGIAHSTLVNLKVKIYQTTPSGLMEQLIFDNTPYGAGGGHSEPAVISLSTHTDGLDFNILNPDNGGSEPWLLVILETYAAASEEDSFAEINFSRPDSDGLELGCVTLYGEYER